MKKAFLCGINRYPTSPLRGCVNDVEDWHRLITTVGKYDPDNVRAVCDERATTQGIKDRMAWLREGAQPGDEVFFQYSGHGSQIRDRGVQDELADHMDEILCVSGDTLISTDKGLVQAATLYRALEASTTIRAKVGAGFFPIKAAARTEKPEVKSIRLENGLYLTLGDEHPVFTFKEGVVRETPAKDVKEGDGLLFPCGPWEGHAELDPIWYLVGLYVGDGHFLTESAIRFGVRVYKDFWMGVADLAKKSLSDAEVTARENKRGDLNVVIRSRILTGLLRGLGFRPKQRKMGRIAELPVPMNEACVKGLLRGLFDSDGSSARRQVCFTSTDYELVKIVTVLLGFFGVRGQISSKKYGKGGVAFTVAIYGHQARKFLDRIGFGVKEKAAKFDENLYPRSGEAGRLELPELVALLDKWNFRYCDFAEALGLGRRNNKRIKTTRFVREQAIAAVSFLREKKSLAEQMVAGEETDRMEVGASIGQIERVCGVNQFTALSRIKRGDDSDVRDYAKKMSDDVGGYLDREWALLKNYDIVRVVGVETVSGPVEMFDFAVEQEAKFEANGVLVHNCPVDLDWNTKVITDDDIADWIAGFPPGVRIIVVLDSCHSGTGTRDFRPPMENPHYKADRYLPPPLDIELRGRSVGSRAPMRRLRIGRGQGSSFVRKVRARAGKARAWWSFFRRRSPKPMPVFVATPVPALNHLLISGCRSDQTSADAYINGRYNGALTRFMVDAFEKNPLGIVSTVHAGARQAILAGGYSQESQLEGPETLLNTQLFA